MTVELAKIEFRLRARLELMPKTMIHLWPAEAKALVDELDRLRRLLEEQ